MKSKGETMPDNGLNEILLFADIPLNGASAEPGPIYDVLDSS
jgi:hypothetical protein